MSLTTSPVVELIPSSGTGAQHECNTTHRFLTTFGFPTHLLLQHIAVTIFLPKLPRELASLAYFIAKRCRDLGGGDKTVFLKGKAEGRFICLHFVLVFVHDNDTQEKRGGKRVGSLCSGQESVKYMARSTTAENYAMVNN